MTIEVWHKALLNYIAHEDDYLHRHRSEPIAALIVAGQRQGIDCYRIAERVLPIIEDLKTQIDDLNSQIVAILVRVCGLGLLAGGIRFAILMQVSDDVWWNWQILDRSLGIGLIMVFGAFLGIFFWFKKQIWSVDDDGRLLSWLRALLLVSASELRRRDIIEQFRAIQRSELISGIDGSFQRERLLYQFAIGFKTRLTRLQRRLPYYVMGVEMLAFCGWFCMLVVCPFLALLEAY